MYGADDDAPTFCEQCGTSREQFGGDAAIWHVCARCDKSVCTNCWNLVAQACLACSPFALPSAVAEPRPSQVHTFASVTTAAPAETMARQRRRPRMPRPDRTARAATAGATRHAGRAVAGLGLATVALAFVAAAAVGFTMLGWAGDPGTAIVEAGDVQSQTPTDLVVAPLTASPTATSKPTPKATPKPKPVHRSTPRPTEKPTPRPTPKPTRKPTPKPAPLVAFLSCSVSGLTVNCSGDASRKDATFAWTFGDGSSASGSSVAHTYAEPGSYSVELTVSAGGDTASDSTSAVITPP